MEDQIIGESSKIKNVIADAIRVANCKTPILIKGENGTGKELVARFVHQAESLSNRPFIRINCGSLSGAFLDSEIFGYEKGVFSSGSKRKKGKFEQAHGGTILLKEVGDLSIEAQARIFKILNQEEFERLGGDDPVKIDVRTICTTSQNLDRLVEKNTFRKDFLLRINVYPIYLPPLRERSEDIIPLAEHFLKGLAQSMGKPHPRLNDVAKAFLLKQNWPGNVRELKNTIERAVINSDDGYIDVSNFTSYFPTEKEKFEFYPDFVLPPQGVDLEKMEANIVRQALELSNNNQSQAAKLLRLSRGKFRILLKKIKERENQGD